MSSVASRETILAALRANRAKLPEPAQPPPEHYLPVAPIDAVDPAALLIRFRAEVEKLTGVVHEPADYAELCAIILGIIGTEQRILAWDALPVPRLTETLTAHGITLFEPHARGTERAAVLASAETCQVGLTGADAAIAATGTLAMAVRWGRGRIPSLLPMVHICLIHKDRLLPRLEDYLTLQGHNTFTETASVVFITGPSRTADIEMQVIRGVHGPGILHYVFYDDSTLA